MNKRGWLRILEASIAIILVLGVLLSIYQREARLPADELGENARAILEEIAYNTTIRDVILHDDEPTLNRTIGLYITDPSLLYEVRICRLNEACGKRQYTAGSVYAAERVISSNVELAGAEPRKVRLFIWRKQQ